MNLSLRASRRTLIISRHISTAKRLPSLPNGELDVSWSDANNLVRYHLNRPKSMNALNMDQVLHMDSQLRSLANDSTLSGILFTGEGDRAFCAGGDVLHIAESALEKSDWNRRWFSSEFLLNNLISTFDKPVISVWRGVVMGGGVGLSIYGSHRIATETTMFAMPETSIGFFPDVGGSYFLSHYIKYPGLGLYLGMTGHRLNGADVVKTGLATHFVPTSSVESLIADLGKYPHLEATVNKYNTQPSIPESITPEFLESVKKYFQFQDWDEFWGNLCDGVARDDSFAVKTMKTIRTKCPLTVRVWFESFKIGSNQSLAQVLEREYHMCIQVTEQDSHNFREGVRALLVDKGKGSPPSYKPGKIEDVTTNMIAEIVESKVGGDIRTCLVENRPMF